VRSDIAVKIFGDNYDELEKIAGEVKELLEKIPGAAEVEFEASGRVPMLEVRVNRDALAKYNLHTADVKKKAVATAMAGQVVGSVIEKNRRFDLVVRMPENYRENFDELRNLPVRVDVSGILPLGKLAEFKTTASVDPIMRDGGQRRAAIMVNLRGRDVESFVREAREKVAKEIKLPEGFSLEFGGAFENLQRARVRLAIVVRSALTLIFVLVFMAFGSLRQSLIIYSGIPLAATGGVFALWLRGMPFSISAGVGFIALSSVAVLNGLVMITYLNQLCEQGKNVNEAILEGALTRLRPVLITAFVASLGFVPTALATSWG
jgi:cobalt-zinc-cadmium resistance protein CzcA